MNPQQITELAKLLRDKGDKLLNNGFSFQLTGSLLRALNDAFTVIMDASPDIPGSGQTFMVLKPNNLQSPVYRDLQLIFDFVQKTTLLCIAHKAGEEYNGIIDISKFRALKRLELQKVAVRQIIGIQPMRSQLQELICVKSLEHIEDIITRCGGDNSNGFVWNELKLADFSYNNLHTIDTSLEFAQYLQHLNLRHNQLVSVEAIKWLPQLKTLDLSYNCLQYVPLLHVEACKRLQSLNISNNFVEDLTGVAKLDAITDLDLSDNCLLEHAYLLPLSVLLTLKYLNLAENPLCCHPKYRLTTAKYLHKNCATVKFILDTEPLTKNEKAVTGAYQLRTNRFNKTSSSISITSSTSKQQTPRSSVGSTFSYSLYTEAETATVTPDLSQGKKQRSCKSKLRIVEIDNIEDIHTHDISNDSIATSRQQSFEPDASDSSDHLDMSNPFDNVPKTNNSERLETSIHKMMTSVLESSPPSQDGRELLDQYLGEFSQSSINASVSVNNETIVHNETVRTSTPTNDSLQMSKTDVTEEIISPIKVKEYETHNESANSTVTRDTLDQTYYTANDNSEVITEDEDPYNKYNIFSTTADDEPQISEAEDDEETYIVYANNSKEPIFLTLSSNYLREKDTSELTKTKWSLKMLESSELISTDTLRLTFDTRIAEKRTRDYKVEDGLCKELQNKLRNILSERDFSEMNQTVYRCVKCDSKFVVVLSSSDVNCPNCHSTFVTEITEQPIPKYSPAMGGGIQELLMNTLPLTVQPITAETNSIGSATSLNESSSCSKITNSQSSFDSNQSVVGSSNTDRDNFTANCESDVDILSNPSQSSIEVLEGSQYSQQQSRTSTEEQTQIEDLELNRNSSLAIADTALKETAELKSNFVHLTESSSSGSVTDSICTAYEQTEKKKNKPIVSQTKLLLAAESNSSGNNQNTTTDDPGKENRALSSVIGAIFQSTNILMAPGAKKSMENGSTSSNQTSKSTKSNKSSDSDLLACIPYKFNYTDFNDIDHRLKLYFLQHKFQMEINEKFKWVVRGQIYNESTNVLYDGLVVVSTCQIYLMEAYAPEHEDVTHWLRILDSMAVNRLEAIQILPWKMGLAFTLRNWGGFLLLLQDILRTDSLLLYFANNPLPSECELNYQISPVISQRLSAVVGGEQLTMCSLLNACEVACMNAKRTFKTCALLATDCHIYLTSEKLSWLSLHTDPSTESDIQVCVKQAIDNLVEVVRQTPETFTIKHFDETHNIEELWTCTFETKENADSCLNAIGQTWETLFGVALCTANV